MSSEFRLQDPGEGIAEAEIVEVHVEAGGEVREGEPLLSVETDKAIVDIPSPFTGRVEELRVKQGDVANVGDVLLTYRASGEPAAESPAPARTEEATEAVGGKAEPPPEPRETQAGPVPAAPSTRRLARELGVELRQIAGSGPGGRVTEQDVRNAAGGAEQPAAPEPEKRPPPPPAPAADRDAWGPVEHTPLASIRRITAQRTQEAWQRIPHVTHHDLADITELERFRRAHKGQVAEAGGKLTFTAIMMKAVVAALKAFPRFNASLDEAENRIVLKRYYHIGVAVDTEQGLLVPVVRDVDRKSLTELAVELKQLADRTRDGKASREELQGSSFTITNIGSIGGTGFTPIINAPEAAILGMSKSQLTPVVKGDLDRHQTRVRLLLPLSLAFDHRLNDGADAARFVRHLIETLADPERLLLNV